MDATVLGWAVFILGALVFWMFWIEPRWFAVTRHEVVLSKRLEKPLTILHLSDTHFSGENKYLDGFFDKLSEEECDFVVVTGDILDCPEGVDHCIRNFSKLKPAKGFFAVLGNHDYYNYSFLEALNAHPPGLRSLERMNPVMAFQEKLRAIGVRLLRNETEEILLGKDALLIHGMDDPVTGHANIRLTLQDVSPEKINILLAHTVDVFLEIGEGEIDLSFSGHSHGGQIRLPQIGPVVTYTLLGREYAGGLHRVKGAHACISRGIATGRFLTPRLFCRPEAIFLKLYGKA